MKKASKVFKSIRFAKMDPNHDKGPKGSTDDEEHYTVDSQEYQQQVDHVKKRSMQEAKIKVNFKMPPESPAERIAREHAARRKASGLPDPSHYKQMAAQKQKEIDAMKNEEVEQLDELKKSTLQSYLVKKTNKPGVPSQKDVSGMANATVRLMGKKPTSEEVELEEGRQSQRHPLEGHEYHKKTNAELEYIAKDAHKAAEAMKGHNTTAENKYRDQANDSATVRYFRKKSGTPDWYKKKYGLSEAKEKTEYDYEGDMARGQLQSIVHHAQKLHDMLKDNDNLPEWVQSKITLAEDYISTVANYMMSEIDEAVNSFVPSSNATPVPKKPKDEYDRKVDKYLKQKYSPPFDPPYKKSTGGTVTDKSGAKHTPMSRARDLARNAMKKQGTKVSEAKEMKGEDPCWKGYQMVGMKKKGGKKVPNCVPESVQIDESRKAQIVREAVKKAKEKNKGNDKFEPEPELNSQVQKVDNV
jgi:hypothetical protein